MASNIKALPEKNMRGAPENRDMPLPLLDLSDAAVKELIRSAKKRGYVTVRRDQLGAALGGGQFRANRGHPVDFQRDGRRRGRDQRRPSLRKRWRPARSRRRKPRARTSWSKSSNGRFRPSPRPRSPPSAPTTPCACISAKWARWNSFRARARSPSPSASRPAARP